MGFEKERSLTPSAAFGGTVSPAGSVGAGRSPPESCALMEGDSPSQEGGFPRGPWPPWERRKKNPPPVAARPSPALTVTTGGGRGWEPEKSSQMKQACRVQQKFNSPKITSHESTLSRQPPRTKPLPLLPRANHGPIPDFFGPNPGHFGSDSGYFGSEPGYFGSIPGFPGSKSGRFGPRSPS